MELSVNQQDQTQRIGEAKYRRISQRFLEELGTFVTNRKSVAILGPRGVGKQHAIEDLKLRLQSESELIVHLRCDDINPIEAEQVVCRQLVKDLGVAGAGSVEECLRQVEEKLRQESPHVTLIVSDADLLPHAVTRRLMMGIRRLTQCSHGLGGTCSAVLTGALELSPLLHGEDSEFTPDFHYVVQGYDPPLFHDLVRKTFASGYEVTDPAVRKIGEVTGCSLVMFHLFCMVLKDLRRRVAGMHHRLDEQAVDRVTKALQHTGFGHSHLHLTAFARIESSAIALRQLEKLLSDSECRIGDSADNESSGLENAPTELELSGLAVRENNRLKWQSPLLGQLAGRYFGWWSLGDAYACCDQWSEAMRCYRMAAFKGHPWIQNPTRRPRLNAAQRAFETYLHRLAGENENPVSAMLDFFIESAPFVLGFDEVRRFERSPDRRVWRAIGSSPGRSDSVYLPDAATCEGCGLIEFPKTAPRAEIPYANLIRLCCDQTCGDTLLLASCFKSRSPITQARIAQIQPVVNALTQAFERACRNEHNQSQTRRQEQLLEALPRVFQIVSPKSTNVTLSALQEAGDKLRLQGYRRVMFSLVDRHASEIRGVLDCRDEGEPDVATATRFDLPKGDGSEFVPTDVQQECVVSQKTVVIEDASSHPLSCEPSVNAGMKGVLLVPLIARSSDVILGTMHVERDDRLPLDEQERESLEYFADQLAVAIHAAIMLDLLEGGVREQPDAVLLLDAEGKIAFANSKASKLLNIATGWRDGNLVAFQAPEVVLSDQIQRVIARSEELDGRFSGYYDFGAEAKKLHVVAAQPLKDWRDVRVGMLVQIADIREASQLWRDIRELGMATDPEALHETALRILKNRGHSWGRIYVTDPDQEILRGTAQFGFDSTIENGLSGAEAFRNGKAELRGPTVSPISWLCLNDNEPKLLEAVLSGSELVGAENRKTALPIRYAADDTCGNVFNKKQVGDRWIDLPLTQQVEIRRLWGLGYRTEAKTHFLGKISIDCPSDMTLEQWEHLRILAEALSSSYATMSERMKRQREEEERKREAMEKAIGETCHRLQSGIVALEVLMQLIENAGTAELREQWIKGRTRLQAILADTTTRLRAFRIERRRGDLSAFLQQFFSAACEPEQYSLKVIGDNADSSADPTQREFPADFDSGKLQEALEELLANSRKATRHPRKPLRIGLTVEALPDACTAEESCRIVYRDNGPGVPADRQQKIFEEWHSHWDDPESQGSGMGMNHVRRIVRAHGGTISCEEDNSGACFVLKFPRWTDPDADGVQIDGVREEES